MSNLDTKRLRAATSAAVGDEPSSNPNATGSEDAVTARKGEVERDGLHRVLSRRSATLLTAGAMIGTGIFVAPSDVARSTSNAFELCLVWVLGAVLSLLGALSFAEAASAMPHTGGMMVYLDKGLGRWSAYAFGWAMMVVLVPSSVGYFAQVAAQYFVPLHGGFAHRWAKSGLVLVVLAFNLRGVLVGARFQDSLTVLKIAGVLAVAALGCVSFFAGGMPITATHHPSVPWSLSRFGVALVAVLWAYDGWIDVTSVAGEVRSPRKSVPFALMAGTLAVAALYLALNAGLIAAFGHYELSVATTPALDVGRSLGGRRLALAVGVLVGVAALGACAVGFMSGVRVVFASAQRGLLFAPLGRVSRRGVPANALVVGAVLAVLYQQSQVSRLGELFVVGAWPFYALGAIAVWRLRARGEFAQQKGAAERFVTPWFPWPQAVFALVAAMIVALYTVREPRYTAVSFAVIFAGFAFWPLFRAPPLATDESTSMKA